MVYDGSPKVCVGPLICVGLLICGSPQACGSLLIRVGGGSSQLAGVNMQTQVAAFLVTSWY